MASKEAFACLARASSCSPARLLDRQALLQASQVEQLVEPLHAAAGPAGGQLAVSCGMLLACAIALPVVPDLSVSVVALGTFVWSVFQTACTPLPTIIFLSLLCLTAVFGSDGQPPRAGRAAGGGKTVAGSGGGRAQGATAGNAGSSERGGSPRKKRR
ncbi:hypothetical protein PLESTB_000528900 [Pleodorina starrii]|uniref:Uncharacterized protein n=1 Tax=Pleodorina starrii TaxID=330485 RepID=A0A9W6BGM4_9CHLO|nr:hypothetical protein PLESTB_000528900 [Pleodorina starrii]